MRLKIKDTYLDMISQEQRKSRGDQKRIQKGRTELGSKRVLKLSPSLK